MDGGYLKYCQNFGNSLTASCTMKHTFMYEQTRFSTNISIRGTGKYAFMKPCPICVSGKNLEMNHPNFHQ